MKKNYKNISLLLISVMLTLSVNGTWAIEQDPTYISGTEIIDIGVNNSDYTEYFASEPIDDTNVGGGIYHVTDTGNLTIGDSSNVIFNNIAAFIQPENNDVIGRMGGVIYNNGNLYIGAELNGETHSGTGYNVTFSNNIAGQGGAINNTGNAYIYNAVFDSNSSLRYTGTDIDDPNYQDNNNGEGWDTANSGRGGAIYNNYDVNNPDSTGELVIIGSEFKDNYAEWYGGAIYNGNGGNVTINGNSNFTGNHSGIDGGVIYNSITNSSSQSAIVNINHVTFDSNYAAVSGGVISNKSEYSSTDHENNEQQASIINIDGATFTNNAAGTNAGSGSGGVISNTVSDNTTMLAEVNITNTTFSNNGILQLDDENAVVTIRGGAISNSATINIDGNTIFDGNKATSMGGAISNSGIANISNATFSNNGGSYSYTRDGNTTNSSTNYGGAIYNSSGSTGTTSLTINNVTFTNNSALCGGALYNGSNATIIDSTFNGNSALAGTASGGAIYGMAGSDTTVIAENSDVNFVTDTDTIYLNAGASTSVGDIVTTTNGAILNLNANEGRNINLNGTVTAATTTDSDFVPVVNVNYDSSGESSYAGNINFNAEVANVDLRVYNGTATADAQVSNSTIETKGGTMKFNDDTYLGTAESATDGHSLNNFVLDGGTLDIQNGVVSNIALNDFTLSSTTNMKVDVDVVNEEMDNLLAENVSGDVNITDGANINISDMNLINEGAKDSADILFTDIDGLTVDNVTTDVETLEGKIYKYTIEKKSGSDLGFTGDAADDVYFSFTNTGGPSDNVTVGPVAQIGAWILMDNIYRQSFANMDMLSILTRDERENLKNYNRYANMFEDEINTFYRDKRQEDYPSVFVRGFTNFEKVPLKRGPHVDGIFYGSLIGHESGLYELGRGWDANYAVFGAYTGAYQHYNGVNMFLNGGNAGGVFTAYKGDYWVGITANAGGWAADANTNYGSEHFPMMGAGVAAKTGYNWRLFNNKFIIQPSYMMSYTFIYAYSHNSASGVRIKQDPLHAIEIIPGVKLIANNFKNGWQPYIGVNMTWVLMDGARFWANDVAFNRLSIRPFVEYGIGIQKHHGEHVTGYLQAMVRNGGRNGVALTGGFRWAIGEDIID